MKSKEKSVCLNVFVDNRKQKVKFAEATEDFVEILCSFLTLPLGTITRLSCKYPNSDTIKVGSLTSLYQSVLNLDVVHFSNELCKDALINPINSSASVCQKLKINLDACVNGSHSHAALVKKKGSFIITDDLTVTPFMLDESIQLLSTLGVEYIDLLDKRTVYFGLEETNNPLTNLVLGGSKTESHSSYIRNFKLGSLVQPKTVQLLVQKSAKKVLCAQVENFFVELLFSFLTIPLGAVKRLTMDNSTPVGINNLYNSISSLGDRGYLKHEDIKTMLLCPKLAATYHRVTNFLPIYEINTNQGSFLKEHTAFIVSDDLAISVSPSFSTISKFTCGVPVGDLEVLEVSIGEPEALLILNASLTSTSVLSDCLNVFSQNPKSMSFTSTSVLSDCLL